MLPPFTSKYGSYLASIQKSRLKEEPPSSEADPPALGALGELEIQALFFNGRLGDTWKTTEGQQLIIKDPGVWNHEAGPDFLGTIAELDGKILPAADLELDFRASDWESHGHRDNPNFNKVGLHFFQHSGSTKSFTRNSENRHITQVQFDLPAAPLPPKTFPLLDDPISQPDEALRVIHLAATHRLQSKTHQLDTSRRLHGDKNALFQALAEGLGYKNNALPMLLLAQRLQVSRATSSLAEALCFGISGFLEAKKFQESEADARLYQRELWETWWRERHDLSRLILPKEAWKLAGNRPSNHPHRRIACLPLLAKKLPILLKSLESNDAKHFQQILCETSHPFWDFHSALTSKARPSNKKQALLGKSRANDLIINILYPWKNSSKKDSPPPESFFKFKLADIPRRIQDAADWFCPTLPPKSLQLAYIQQGLIQLHRDFRGTLTPQNIAKDLTY